MKMFLFGIIVMCGSEYASGFLYWHQDCTHMAEYQAVANIPKSHPCMSETQIWATVNQLEQKSPYCLNIATANNAAYVKQHPGQQCSCPGKFHQKQFHTIPGHQDHLINCLYNPDCKTLGERYYFINSHGQELQCQSQAYVWPLLAKVGVVGGVDTRSELILHFGKDFTNECTCKKVEPTTTKATAPPTTTKTTAPPTTTETTVRPTTTKMTAPPTTTKTTVPPTTTKTTVRPTTTKSTVLPTTTELAFQIGQVTCLAISTITDLGNHHSVANEQASMCSNGNRTSPEAFVLDHCDTKSPSLWKQGSNVMKYCSSIPLYTPVATFVNNTYASVGGLTGIFVGCLENGFKLGVQRCESVPDIEHIERGGLYTLNPDLYYIIV